MNDSFMELTSRHALIWDNERIDILKKSHVVLIGLGGFGTHIADQLIRLGLGKLTLIDFDDIELSNLNRQSLFTAKDIGKNKAECAKNRLLDIVDPEITGLNVKIYSHAIDITTVHGTQVLETLCLDGVNCWIDNIDNIEAKSYLNAFLKKHNQVLIQPYFLTHYLNIDDVDTSVLRFSFQQSVRLRNSNETFDKTAPLGTIKQKIVQPMSVQMCAIAASAMTYAILYELWKNNNSLIVSRSSEMDLTLQFDPIKNKSIK